MATPRSRRAARHRERRRRAQHRARRLAVIGIVAALALVTLILTAFDSGSPPVVGTKTTPVAVIDVPPEPDVLATVSNLQIKLPVAGDAVTAIGFHGAGAGAVELNPVGRQLNEGLLARLWRRIAGSAKDGRTWIQLDGGTRANVMEVGAMPGTDVYAPASGTVVSLSDFVIDGKRFGSTIDVRPSSAPSLIISLSHVQPDPSLTVGSPVLASSSKLGTVVDVAAVERQALARHAGARGNNVSIEVHPAAGSLP
jgi:hypothetical protein